MSEETGNKTNYGTVKNVEDQTEPAVANETEKREKIISGEVIERKKGLGRKIVDTFTGVDARTVGHSVVFDVVLPQLRGMAVDAGTQALERLILGDSAMARRSNSAGYGANKSRGTGYTAYNRYSSSSRNEEEQSSRSDEVREVIVQTRGDAQKVIDELAYNIDRYGAVSLATFYELVGITGRFTDHQWGWTNINAAGVSRVREGFRIELPRPTSIK